MMNNKSFQRTDRVADAIHRELAVFLQTSVKDPRMESVTIAAVSVTKDLSMAIVYFSLPETQNILETTKVLNKASGFFRSKLAKKMSLCVIPRLKFIYDASQDRGYRLTALIDKVSVRDEKSDVVTLE